MATRTVSTKRRWQYEPTPGEGKGIAALAQKLKRMRPGGRVMVAYKASEAGDDAIDVSPGASEKRS
jgi:hypothetical protein